MKAPTDSTPAAAPAGFFVSGEKGGKDMARLADEMEKLSKITPRLNKATDRANSAFRATEELLAKAGIGIDTVTGIRTLESQDQQKKGYDGDEWTDYTETTDRELFLTYERISSKYRIGFVVRVAVSVGPNELRNTWEPAIAWDQAAREWKLEGVACLLQLVSKLAESAETLSAAAEKATDAVEEMLRDLKAPQ